MTSNLQKSRDAAKLAIIAYVAELSNAGYNKRYIQDSVNDMSLDVIIQCDQLIKE